MGKDGDLDAVQADDVIDSFICCICLDLLYKPVVLSCGHMSCFWCVHLSMSSRCDSHCPICREPYNHFPAICEMLHYLLSKMYPKAYKRRKEQILEEEKSKDCFSPQIGHSSCQPLPSPESDHQGDLENSARYYNFNSSLNASCTRKEEPCETKEQAASASEDTHDGNHEVFGSASHKLKRNYDKISAVDVQCVSCKQLLFRPVVLNCGHVYCQTCVPHPMDDRIKCQVCQSLHPKCIPKVCLEFNHFLEGVFQNDYAIRKISLQDKQAHTKNAKSSIGSTTSSKWRLDNHSKVHAGVGCDACGAYPIVGDRYRCKDCTEKIGYDLCGDCYKTRSKLPGRFNQQHTAEHKFELVNPNIFQTIMLRLMNGQGESMYTITDSNGDASQSTHEELIFSALVQENRGSIFSDPNSPSPFVRESHGSNFSDSDTDVENADNQNNTQSNN